MGCRNRRRGLSDSDPESDPTWIVDDKPGTSGIWKRLTGWSSFLATTTCQITLTFFTDFTGQTPDVPGTSGCFHLAGV